MVAKCTIFKNLFDKEPYCISVDAALERIKFGKSKELVNEIREYIDKDRQDVLKKNLPSVCFSGIFKERKDECIITHSGFIVLDFDNVYSVDEKKKELSANEYAYACWISPRNNGIKLLIRVADGKCHREHFESLRETFKEADKSGINEARVCFESYDPDLYINKNAKVWAKLKTVEKIQSKIVLENEKLVFVNLVKWLTNRNDTFITGERNIFVFKLASACCRFGLSIEVCQQFIKEHYEIGTNKFSVRECEQAIGSAYKANKQLAGTAQFDKDVLVDKTSRREIEITQEMLDENIRPKDVIFGEDVKEEAFDLFNNGYKSLKGIGVDLIDNLFKLKEGENSLFSGYGNYGKSTFMGWLLLMRVLLYGEKYAFFTPENIAHEFYFDLVEILLGARCTPDNKFRPSKDEYEFAYDFISKYIFYVYPKTLSPTPDYIKERFLELIIKEGVKGVIIDPFNQLSNDYKSAGGRSDKYLETFLSDSSRFAQQNNIYSIIVAHPTKAHKDSGGNYPCPDVFDIADGAMWNNKMDNILIYHRPNHQTEPESDECELHSKKIRRQKSVGKIGSATFNLNRATRRYEFNGVDYMSTIISNSDYYKKTTVKFNPIKDAKSGITPSERFETVSELNPFTGGDPTAF